jgi:lipoprotein-releasing system permease protein
MLDMSLFKLNTLNPSEGFNQKLIFGSGVFAIQQDFDTRYAFVDLQTARELFEQVNGYSYINIKLKKGFKVATVQSQLTNLLDEKVVVKNRIQQNSFIYLIMQIEKWVVFAILCFILIIASFNFIGSLSMIAIDKQKDMAVLQTLGASTSMLKQIYIYIGLLMITVGTAIGLVLGTVVCFGQQHFHWLQLQGNSFVIESYPVDVQALDYVYIIAIVAIIGFVASYIPSRKVGAALYNLKQG